MRIFNLTLLAFFLLTVPAQAALQQDFADCNQGDDVDRKLRGCTRALANKLTSQQRSIALTLRALAYAHKVNYNSAIEDLSEAIRLNPKNADAWRNRGEALSRKGETDRAFADLKESIRLDPKSFRNYSIRASVWRQLGDLDRALADFDESVRLEPKFSMLYNNRALIWRDKGDYGKALADYDTAIRLDPKNEKAYANRGEIWRLKGDLDQALADQEQQVKRTPKSVNAYQMRGDTFRYKGEFDRAIADYDKSLTLLPDNIPAYTGRGLTFEKMGDLERARREFEKALASSTQDRSDISKSSLETATVRLAALNSGGAQPTIPAAPSKATSATSVPTPSITPLKPVDPGRAQADTKQGRRVALVIGNSDYKSVAALANPKNDADAIARSLRGIGFESVTLVNDATREKLIDALRSFANEAETSDWAMVYYAGHGIEVGGVNYLIPVDAKLAVDRDIEYEAVAVHQVLRAADSAKKIKLVMLDACRDNPFKPRKTEAPAAIAAAESTAGRAIATRSSTGRGLAEVKVQGATLVVFAAKDGQVALDGEGANSPFAVAVVQRIATPGVEINKVFRLVRDDVMEATAGRQEPYTYGSLPGKEDFYFVAK